MSGNKQQEKSDIGKLGITLALYAAIACGLLAVVDRITAPLIAQAKEKETTAGLKVVFPNADGFEEAADFVPDTATNIKVERLFLAKKGGQVNGAVVQATGPTYDKATILIGLDLNRAITSIQFTSLTDTPGFGQKATEPAFSDQFKGKSANDAFEVKADVTPITGATITSKGVSQILKYATYVAGEYLAKNYGGAAGTGAAPVVSSGEAAPFTYEEAFASIFGDAEGVTVVETEALPADYYPRTMGINRLGLVQVDGKTAGAYAAAQGQSYHGAGVVLAVIGADGKIAGARIIELPDTPKIGLRALEEEFWRQFDGLAVSEPILADAQYDTLSGASISADCVADMAKVAAVEAAKYLAANGGPAYTGGDDYPLNEHYLEE